MQIICFLIKTETIVYIVFTIKKEEKHIKILLTINK